MARKMEFEIEGAKALAVMHDDLTPKACDAIWETHPEGLRRHLGEAADGGDGDISQMGLQGGHAPPHRRHVP